MSEQEVKELPTETKEKVAVETKVEDTKASSKGDDAAQEATNADTSTTESVKRKDPIEATGEPKRRKREEHMMMKMNRRKEMKKMKLE